MADLPTLLATPIHQAMDASIVAELLAKDPFITIPGVANVRDLGGLPVSRGPPASSNSAQEERTKLRAVRSGRLFRCGQLNRITPSGREKLKELNIGAIFDLRTLEEVQKFAQISSANTDPKVEIQEFTDDRIMVHHIPISNVRPIDPKDQMAMLIARASEDGLLRDYDEMLQMGGESFSKIMKYIVEQARLGDEGKACVWHCQIGKDRTGVFTALLLELLGVSDAAIAQDYAFSRVGLEPIRPALINQWKGLFDRHPEAGTVLASCNAGLMMRFLDILRSEYGGARGYFTKYAGMANEDLDLVISELSFESL